jgi:hypothetical protein
VALVTKRDGSVIEGQSRCHSFSPMEGAMAPRTTIEIKTLQGI